MAISTLEIIPTSTAEELGFEALKDISTVTKGAKSRVIGGYMVTLHTYRHGLQLPRQTRDADLGIVPHAIVNLDILTNLTRIGYTKVGGNRFEKTPDNSAKQASAIIDIVIPSYTSRFRHNQNIGGLVTDEVPGLAEAFQRPPVVLTLKVAKSTESFDAFKIQIPDEIASLILKVMTRTVRRKDSDAVDIWRCLEICNAANIRGIKEELNLFCDGKVTKILKDQFLRNGQGLDDIKRAERLSSTGHKARTTRIHALIERLL